MVGLNFFLEMSSGLIKINCYKYPSIFIHVVILVLHIPGMLNLLTGKISDTADSKEGDADQV